MSHRIARIIAVVVAVAFPYQSFAQSVSFLEVPEGYRASTLSLGVGNAAGALVEDPVDENFVYVAGMFDGATRIVHVDLRDGQWTAVYDAAATVSIGGFAVLAPDVMFISDNMNDQLLILEDNNPQDGDFNDPGEVRDLIAPILTHPTFGWTGNAVRIVRSGNNQLGLPANTVLFQSEDGNTTEGEVLAVVDPTTSPSYQPDGGAFFSGFDYGGGLVIDSYGRLILASSSYPDTGKIWVCEDTSGDGVIDDGESSAALSRVSDTTEQAGLSTLAIDRSDRCYTTVGWGGFGAPAESEIRMFSVPENNPTSTSEATVFARLDSPFINAIVFSTLSRTFDPSANDGAMMVISATDGFYGNLDYLLIVRPFRQTGVKRWDLY